MIAKTLPHNCISHVRWLILAQPPMLVFEPGSA